MSVTHSTEFDKEVKDLGKKYRHIEEDIETFKQALQVNSYGNGNIAGAYPYGNLGSQVKAFVYKAEKFNSTDFRRTDKFRLVYAYFSETGKFLLLRIYCKAGYEKIEEKMNKETIYKYCC